MSCAAHGLAVSCAAPGEAWHCQVLLMARPGRVMCCSWRGLTVLCDAHGDGSPGGEKLKSNYLLLVN